MAIVIQPKVVSGPTMIRILCMFLVFHARYLSIEATPLVGKDVRIAENYEFPFIVSLSFNSKKHVEKEEKNHKCTGSLITRKHVLTAAHCVEDVRNYNEVVVKVGSIDLRNTKIHEIDWWVTYNQWEENGEADLCSDDIAIIKLVKSVCSIDKIHLPILSKIPELNLYSKTVTVAGWGLIEFEQQPRYLRTAELSVIPYNESLYYLPELDLTPNPNPILFTKIQPFALLTCGDSGGPLMINRREIVGVNLAQCSGRGDNDPCKRNYQNAHSSVLYYIRFITDVIRNRY